MTHIPVLLSEVLRIFNPQPGQTYIDMTLNGGGHSAAIAKRISPGGTLLGIDLDGDLIRAAESQFSLHRFNSRIIFQCANYADIKSVAEKNGIAPADGILFDLGFSSYHTDESGRGFSFQRDEPLDMRYGTAGNAATAEEIVNHDSPKSIERIIRQYGEERYASRIARAIAEERRGHPIRTTRRLADIVRRAIPAQHRTGRIHPATRTFQALRIAVNRELENLRKGLSDSAELLALGGTVIVISFHSLEDRIAKTFIRQKEKQGLMQSIAKKPIVAPREETAANPRARSARLRAAKSVTPLS